MFDSESQSLLVASVAESIRKGMFPKCMNLSSHQGAGRDATLQRILSCVQGRPELSIPSLLVCFGIKWDPSARKVAKNGLPLAQAALSFYFRAPPALVTRCVRPTLSPQILESLLKAVWVQSPAPEGPSIAAMMLLHSFHSSSAALASLLRLSGEKAPAVAEAFASVAAVTPAAAEWALRSGGVTGERSGCVVLGGRAALWCPVYGLCTAEGQLWEQ